MHVQDREWVVFLILMTIVVIVMLVVIGNVEHCSTNKNNVNIVDTVFVYPDSGFYEKRLEEYLRE